MQKPPAASSSVHFASVLLPDGWARNVRVEIAGGCIRALERNVAAVAGDELVAVALPGMANVHSHAFQRGMAGLTEYQGADADNFWSWRELMYRFVSRMTPDDIEAISALAYVEMLESGFTRVGEFHYVHHDPAGKPYADLAEMAVRIAAACTQTGIGLTLLPVFYAHGGFGGQAPTDGQRRFINDVPRFAKLLEASRRAVASLPDAILGVAPHSLRAVTPSQLAEVVALQPAGPIQIHAAEQTQEVEECLAWSGARPVQWLLDHVALDGRWCLVHATHQTPEDIERFARSGAIAGFCPITEANLGDGLAPAAPFLRQGGTFGIGTDSNVRIGVAAELQLLEYSQRLRDRSRNVLCDAGRSTGRSLFEGALRGGAQATGTHKHGADAGLAIGASADFFSLNPDAPTLAERGADALLDSMLFAGGHDCIDAVWRAGRKVVSHGQHHAREAVVRAYRAVLAGLLAR